MTTNSKKPKAIEMIYLALLTVCICALLGASFYFGGNLEVNRIVVSNCVHGIVGIVLGLCIGVLMFHGYLRRPTTTTDDIILMWSGRRVLRADTKTQLLYGFSSGFTMLAAGFLIMSVSRPDLSWLPIVTAILAVASTISRLRGWGRSKEANPWVTNQFQ